MLTLSRSLKTLTMVFAAAAVFGIGQRVARADPVFISGSTLGCLCADPTNAQPFFSTGGLTFNNASFRGTTTDGTFNLVLGNLSLDSSAAAFDGQQFSLIVTFIAPLGIGGSPLPFSALLTGTVDGSSPDFLIIDFDNTPRTLAFANSLGTGSFSFAVFDAFALPGGGTFEISGGVFGATFHPVPEPATLILLATGLAGVAGASRRRARQRRL